MRGTRPDVGRVARWRRIEVAYLMAAGMSKSKATREVERRLFTCDKCKGRVSRSSALPTREWGRNGWDHRGQCPTTSKEDDHG